MCSGEDRTLIGDEELGTWTYDFVGVVVIALFEFQNSTSTMSGCPFWYQLMYFSEIERFDSVMLFAR